MAGSLPVGMQQHLPVDRGRWSAVVGGFLSRPPQRRERREKGQIGSDCDMLSKRACRGSTARPTSVGIEAGQSRSRPIWVAPAGPTRGPCRREVRPSALIVRTMVGGEARQLGSRRPKGSWRADWRWGHLRVPAQPCCANKSWGYYWGVRKELMQQCWRQL